MKVSHMVSRKRLALSRQRKTDFDEREYSEWSKRYISHCRNKSISLWSRKKNFHINATLCFLIILFKCYVFNWPLCFFRSLKLGSISCWKYIFYQIPLMPPIAKSLKSYPSFPPPHLQKLDVPSLCSSLLTCLCYSVTIFYLAICLTESSAVEGWLSVFYTLLSCDLQNSNQ